ncbi:MAG TPA: hypothetical protein VF498_14460 [Anaerolineales bacterium]
MLTLAADARLVPTDYCDDQIWELSLAGGEPPALALQTTFGLRARALRLLPRFTEGEVTLTDPAGFASEPVVTRFYPNFISLAFAPFPGIDVQAEYWVPQSHSVAGRIRVLNSSKLPRQVLLSWVGLLTPTEGQSMGLVEMQAAPVLCGQTGDLFPVVFMTGGPQVGAGTYPSLSLALNLPPGGSQPVIWSQAALHTAEESFALARHIAARRWEAELARLELLNSGQVEIYTGEADWDAAFALTQKLAYELFVGPSAALSQPSFVFTRQPDQGFSLRGDGTDYNHLWNGQSPLEAYYLAGQILPAAPGLAQGLLRNFLATQAEDGSVDWKPGLSGQRSRLLATPILASLAWRIYEASGDRAFLEEVFPSLLEFVRAWFAPQHDRDGDGIPEWDHPMQAGLDDHPLFSRWHPWSQGVEINTAEGPGLCSFLYRECRALMRMADCLGRSEPAPGLQALAGHLRTAVEASWRADEASYHDWDRDTHDTPPAELLGQRSGPGTIPLDRPFERPARLLVKIVTSGESTRRPQVFVHGVGASGHHRVERIGDERFRWHLGWGTLTGELVYTSLERVEVQGLDPSDQVSVFSAGYEAHDQSLLLPLWAGIPSPETARELVQKTIANPDQYWRPYGLPVCPQPEANPENAECASVHLTWNALIGEGLVNYGFRSEAAELVTRLMSGIVASLKRESAFHHAYHCETGQGVGERNALTGLAPLDLFLKTLGVRLISSQHVELSGFNPFPWPVTVKYRGMTILRQKEKTMVIFPDGQTAVVSDPEPRIISLELEPAENS